jgi:hypothetical protein
VQQIKQQIDRLSFQEYCELMAMLQTQEDDAWDQQMKDDAGADRLDNLMDSIDRSVRTGRVKDMPE